MKSRASKVTKSSLSQLLYNSGRPTTFPTNTPSTSHTSSSCSSSSLHSLAADHLLRQIPANCVAHSLHTPANLDNLNTSNSTMGRPSTPVQHTMPTTPSSTKTLNGTNGINGHKWATSLVYTTPPNGIGAPSPQRFGVSSICPTPAPATPPSIGLEDRALALGIFLPLFSIKVDHSHCAAGFRYDSVA
jgi:hypothetical protein